MLPVAGQLPADGNYTGIAGPLTSLQLPLAPLNDNNVQPAGTLDNFFVLIWNGVSYNSVWYEADYNNNTLPGVISNGWSIDQGGSAQGHPPVIGVGQGFFINNLGNNATWAQGLTTGF